MKRRLVDSYSEGATSGWTLEEDFLKYVRILFTSIGVLQSFLEEIDPAFVVCHDWDLLGDETQAAEIAAFVSPNDKVAHFVKNTLVGVVAAAKHVHEDSVQGLDIDEMIYDGTKQLLLRLQDKLDLLEARYCGVSNRAV